MSPRSSREKQNILILGAGFAGVRAALDLSNYLADNENYDIILVDRKDYQLYNSALYEAATTEHDLVEAKKVKRTVAIPLAKIFAKTKVKVYKAYIESIDLENGLVVTDSRIINYSHLVVGMGSTADFYGIPGLEKYSYTLKSLEDAIMIRNRVEDIAVKKDSARIVIGGGGFAGAEFAGELMGLIHHECKVHNKDPKNFEILVVEGGTCYLPGLPENISSLVNSRLTALGVKAKFSTLLTEAGKDYIVLNKKEKVECDLLIWTGGVRSVRLPIKPDLERDKKDRTAVTEFLNLKKYPNVFLAGDNAGYIDPATKKPVAQTAQEAIKHGKIVARNVYRLIQGKNPAPYIVDPSKYVIPVSGKYAVFYSKNLIIPGIIGWFMRRAADLRYLLSILPFFYALHLWLFENKIFMKND
jgi:NADH:ubiquinone reductase (H+-translocating)